jgi:hypothetical protein
VGVFKPNSNRPQPVSANKPEENTGPTKLAQLWAVPSLEDLQGMLEATKRNSGTRVEQPFSVSGQDSLFQLCVSMTESADPVWKFQRGTLSGLTEVWTLPSIDLGLIHNLVLSESTGQQSVDVISASSSKSLSTTGTFSLGIAEDREQVKESEKTTGMTEMQRLLSKQREVNNKIQAVSLEGDLEKLQLSAVLQSLSLTKMTGRLAIVGPDCGAEIYVVEGKPCHATTGDAIGDNALIELLSWDSGKFRLMENQRPTVTTVTKRLETMLMEGAALQDQYQHLKTLGLGLDTYLVQVHVNLSEMQFEQTVRQGPQVSMQMLKDLWVEIDGHTTLYDLLRRLPLTKAEWVPLLFNLTQVGLLTLAKEKPHVLKAPEARVAPHVKLDETAMLAALRPMQRTETEIFTYPILQYLVKQEVARFEVDSKPFALIVFDLFIEKDTGLSPVPLSAVKLAMQTLKELVREIDIIGHFETLDYAVVLPQTTGRSATIVAQRMAEKLKVARIEGLGTHLINACFGVAAVPQDTTDPGGLMLAAADAKKNARNSNLMIVEYKTMS